MEVLSLIIYTKYFWDFDVWPFNRGWPLNGGSTVRNVDPNEDNNSNNNL